MKDYSITDYGAIGDGSTVNTASIQKAVDACRADGGGRIVIPTGDFVSGTICLHSNMELRLDPGAVLLASKNGEDYPDFSCDQWNKDDAPRATSRCMIYAGFCENVSITGMGTINCQGSHFCKEVLCEDGNYRFRRISTECPARMIFIMGCSNVRLEDFTMREMAGGWGCWINNCQYVSADKVKMYCNPRYPNSDGIHVNCSVDVCISNCIIHSGDDCIIVRANTKTLPEKRPCERIVVKGCVLSSKCNAIRVAWREDGIIRNCVFSDLVVTDSSQGLTIELPDHSHPTDTSGNSTRISNLCFNNIVLDRIARAPIKVYIHPDNLVDRIQDIVFSNVTSTSGEFPHLVGREDSTLKNICLDNCRFNIVKPMTASLPFIHHVENLQMCNTQFNVSHC